MASMLKAVFFLTLCVVLYYLANFLNKYIPYAYEEIQPFQISMSKFKLKIPQNSTRRLQYLNELVQTPIVGRFFREQKIVQHIKLYQFDLSLMESEKAIKDPIYARSFNVWYHKALSECVLGEFSDCQSSLTWASLYADEEAQPYVEDIYKILEATRVTKQIKMGKGQENNEIVITFPEEQRVRDSLQEL